jgi:hypothetical protein
VDGDRFDGESVDALEHPITAPTAPEQSAVTTIAASLVPRLTVGFQVESIRNPTLSHRRRGQ